MVDLAQGVFAGNGLGTYSGEMLIPGGLTIVFSAAGAFLYRGRDWV